MADAVARSSCSGPARKLRKLARKCHNRPAVRAL